MIITNGKQNDKISIRQLWDECFSEDSVEWRNWYFDNIFNIDNTICAKQNGELLSMVHMNSYPMMMRSGIINAYALAGVATKEEYRQKGYAGNLIEYSLKKAYKLGYDFSFLYPFKYEFYEKFGYSLGYNKFKYNYKYFAREKVHELKVIDTFDNITFAKIYSKFVKDKNGYIIRSNSYYDIHLKELLCDNNRLVCFSIGDNFGYFCVNKDKTKIEEMAYEGYPSDAINAIGNYLRKDISFENLYDLPDIINKKEPHCMGRIISVENIFKKIKCKDVQIKIKIKDEMIKENNGIWSINSFNGRTQITKVSEKEDYIIDIFQLTSIITGVQIDGDNSIEEIRNLLFDNAIPFVFEVC